MRTKITLALIMLCLVVIAVFGYKNRRLILGETKEQAMERRTEELKQKLDPNNKELVEKIKAEIKGYVDEAKNSKIDYAKMNPEELIAAETTLLSEVSREIMVSIKEYEPDQSPNTFEKVRPELMRNAVKWGLIIKQRDLTESKEGYNEARTKYAEAIKRALTDLGEHQAMLQMYPDGMLNSLMFKRVLDEVSGRMPGLGTQAPTVAEATKSTVPDQDGKKPNMVELIKKSEEKPADAAK